MGSSKKDSPKAPAPPDPVVTSEAQAKANVDAINQSARVNRYDQSTPYGSVIWNRPSDDPSTWSQQVQLSPQYQRQFDQQNQIGLNLGDQALGSMGNLPQGQFNTQGLPQMQTGLNQGQLPQMRSDIDMSGLPQLQTGLNTGQMPGWQTGVNAGGPELATGLDTGNLQGLPTDFSSDAQRLERATYDRAMGLMSPEFDKRGQSLENQLALQGIPKGSEAYEYEMDRFNQARSNAELAAALDSVGAGRSEQSRLFDVSQRARQQGVNEQLASAGLASGARGQYFGEGLTNANLTNQARQGMTQEQLASAGLASGARGQLYGENVTGANFANQARQQGVNEQLQDAGLAQTARQQGVSERQTTRNQAYNELAMLLGASPQMQTMNAPPTAQYQVAPTDRLGAEQLAYQGQLNNYNAQVGQQGAKKGGMTNLAGTVASNLPWGSWF